MLKARFLFYILIISLPINLGLHFILPSSYVGGLLVDYLVPTVFVQDILAVLLCKFWITEDRAGIYSALRSKKALPLVLLVYILFLSTLMATRFVPSFYLFLRWLIYVFVCLYVREKFNHDTDTKFISKVLSYWLLFLGLLALNQYVIQGSVFNNYLVLGEQPYSAATPLIARENIFGVARVPAYGIFRHPNIFGGFLAISLIWVLNAYKKKFIKTKLFLVSFLSGLLGLVLTFSFFSWVATLLGVFLLLAEKAKYFRNLILFIFVVALFSGLIINKIPFPEYLLENPSISTRIDLLNAGYKAASAENYIFGTGINSSTVFIEKFSEPTGFLRFVQPPHNIFILLVGEIGIIGTALFLLVFIMALVRSRQSNFLGFVTLLQILFLSSFDHYFVTIHQTFLLLWLTVGIVI